MRVMALDYGTRRTGVAVCDELGITVRPVETIGGANRLEAVHRAAALTEAMAHVDEKTNAPAASRDEAPFRRQE